MQAIELRSDTFTLPTPGMLDAMWSAQVGDDVFEEDETTILLEKKTADIFGYEAGLFCVSGTMANQIAIMVHTKPGDEVICDALSHIYLYEGGGIMSNAGASVQLLNGDRGRLSAQQIAEVIQPNNIHHPISKLVSLENTVNKGGGAIYDLQNIKAIKNCCTAQNMYLHLDGARLFNALTVTQDDPKIYGQLFDSITICLSKGLGTPMGTVLLGNKQFIAQARRVRKRLGGGWRQSGYMAAAGIYALDHNITRLAEDHARAKILGSIVANINIVTSVLPIDTNIVIFSIDKKYTAATIANEWNEANIKVSPFGKHQIRMVTHLGFTDDNLEICKKVFSNYSK